MDITEYRPRDVFMPLHKRNKRWAVVIAHRRAGKTVAMCADLIIGAMENPLEKPQFAYLAPFRDQAKKVAWTYLKDLSKPLWAKPPNESELKLVLKNGHGGESTIYVAGADNPDALRGMYFDGVVLDEVGQIRPSAWYSVLRPSLSDRRGWAIFAGTPAGKNFFWQMREEARLNPETHILLELPASKTGILHPDELRDAKAQMTEEAFATEYEISFDAAIPGAYYAKLIGEAYEQGRVGEYPVDPENQVDLVADLGYTDSCSWWGWQTTPDGYRIVDFYEADGQPINHYIDWIKARPYKVGNVYLPHDAKAKSLQTGKSIIEQFLIAGITPRLVPELGLQDGIEAARLTLPKCWFDEKAVYDGVEHLRGYMREWDEKTQTYRNRPKHDQHSHCFVAGTLVSTPGGPKAIDTLQVGDFVLTPGGKQPVDAVMCREANTLLELTFDTGAKVTCTPDHPFVTTDGILLADALRYSHQVVGEATCSRNIPFRNTRALSFIESLAAITEPALSSTADERFTCTDSFGSAITAQFRKVITSITSTVTKATTASKTWSYLLSLTIFPITPRGLILADGLPDWHWQERRPRHGMLLTKADAGMQKTLRVCGRTSSYALMSAYDVERLTKVYKERQSATATGFAPTPAKQLRGWRRALITSLASAVSAMRSLCATSTAKKSPVARLVQVKRLDKRAVVYDLTIRNEHVFYANNLLVGNCADAFRYLALATKPISGKLSSRDANIPTRRSDGNVYAFALDDIWDCQSNKSGRLG